MKSKFNPMYETLSKHKLYIIPPCSFIGYAYLHNNVSYQNTGYIFYNKKSDLSDVSDEYIDKYKNQLNWYNMSNCIELSDHNIRKYKNYLNFQPIAERTDININFIDKHIDMFGIC